jgi:hypothetical protein
MRLMTRGQVVAKVCLPACLAASCGGSESPAFSQAALDACQQLHRATGEAEAACNGGMVADWQAYADQVAPCSTYARNVGDGSVRFEAAALAACLIEIQAAPCEAVSLSSTCEHTKVFVGQVADGAPCGDFSVCGPSSYCPTPGCNPTCRRPPEGAALGESCASNYCATGGYCDPASRLCVTAVAAGGACRGNNGIPCVPGFDCFFTGTDANGDLIGTCAARVASGPCTRDHNCVSDQFCYQGTCKPLLRIGDPCGDANIGCTGFSACDTASASPTCVHAGLLGEPCAPLADAPALCIGGAVCDGFRCVAPGQLGDACIFGTCATPLVCQDTCAQCPSADAGQP